VIKIYIFYIQIALIIIIYNYFLNFRWFSLSILYLEGFFFLFSVNVFLLLYVISIYKNKIYI
jgi:hypothetical protein